MLKMRRVPRRCGRDRLRHPRDGSAAQGFAESPRYRRQREELIDETRLRPRIIAGKWARLQAGRLHDLSQLELKHGRLRRRCCEAHAHQKLERGKARVVRGLAAQASGGRRSLLERILRAEAASAEISLARTVCAGAIEQRLAHRFYPHPWLRIGFIGGAVLLDP